MRKLHNKEAGYIEERANPHLPRFRLFICKGRSDDPNLQNTFVVTCVAHSRVTVQRSLYDARSMTRWPHRFCDGCKAQPGVMIRYPVKDGA